MFILFNNLWTLMPLLSINSSPPCCLSNKMIKSFGFSPRFLKCLKKVYSKFDKNLKEFRIINFTSIVSLALMPQTIESSIKRILSDVKLFLFFGVVLVSCFLLNLIGFLIFILNAVAKPNVKSVMEQIESNSIFLAWINCDIKSIAGSL